MIPRRRSAVWLGRAALAVSIAAASLAAMLAGPVSALATDPPVWKVLPMSEPTHLVKPRGQVEELTVKATGGEVFMLVVVGSEFHFVAVPYNVSAAVFQAELEAQVGAGNVEVTGGPGDASGSQPYVITFTGALLGEPVTVRAFGFFAEPETESTTLKVTQEAANGGMVVLTAINVGGPTDGSRVTISDSLPSGLSATGLLGYESYGPPGYIGAGHPLGCEEAPPVFSCSYEGVIRTGDELSMRIPVKAQPNTPAELLNEGSVAGGGLEEPTSASAPLMVSGTPAGFGLDPGSVVIGTSSRQAGAHPDVTTSFDLATSGYQESAGDVKDVRVDMPAGLVGNTVGMPRCPAARAVADECPRDTIVGVATVQIRSTFVEAKAPAPLLYIAPVYNIAPSPGEPAAFSFTVVQFPTRLDTSVLSDGDYAVRVTAANITEADPILSSAVTIWGVPADHEGPGPIVLSRENGHPNLAGGLGNPAADATRVPLLTNPTQCSSPLSGRLEIDEWGAQGMFTGESASLGTMTGCGALPFSASMSMLPDTLQAGAPAGYDFKLHVPQANDADSRSQPNVRRVVAALPMGTVISPSAATGLKSCSDEQFFGPASQRGLERPATPGVCPRESQVGTVEIRTPALPLPLTGDVYLARPDCEPCSPADAQDGKMARLFVQVIGEGQSGVVVKLEGSVSVNQQTGQLTATFDNNPQLPFSDFRLTLGGGPRATLANPRICGPASTNLDVTPWTSPFATNLSATSAFEINEGCIAPQFDPSFVAGTTNIQAGEYSPFTLSFGRSDSDEFLNGLQMQMPPGLLGSLKSVPLCKEPQAALGSCSEDSLIGHTQVLTGPGQTPFLVTGGKVFLTEGYKGAPFGLSIVVPAKAGPYTLSGTTGNGAVVVRAAINVDPHSVALTVTSDPLPTVLDGIPLQLKVVNVTIDRPDFTFNPTSCAKTAITGTLSSKESGGAHVSSPFQVTNCARLGFKPTFKVATSGRTSRANGASLDVKLTYPKGAKYANIAKVKVKLPKQLPSRLTTLQKACPAATFDANPGNCPKASIVGIARASTPILPVQLTGPAYFVSHGGEAFPNLIVILQGYGVRVDLVGDTFISKKGITSSTFNHVPDVPIESFELYLPQGPGSALAANGNLCKSTLKMPTTFVAQNGMTIRRSTPIAATGCARKTKKARNARAARKRHNREGNARQANRPNAANRRGK